jgi:rRNA maturation endonuclease Nob1
VTMATTDKEALEKRVVEEAATNRAAGERATEEAMAKVATAEEVADKTVDKAAGVVGGSPAPS